MALCDLILCKLTIQRVHGSGAGEGCSDSTDRAPSVCQEGPPHKQPSRQMAAITSILESWKPRPREGKDLSKVTQFIVIGLDFKPKSYDSFLHLSLPQSETLTQALL